jgi:hypothetical protein
MDPEPEVEGPPPRWTEPWASSRVQGESRPSVVAALGHMLCPVYFLA